MLRFIYGDRLNKFPRLADSMFRDRAAQFSDRLGWDVSVDANGHERDEYDALNPLYVIWQDAGGRHAGSMRFLPTTGRTMVNEHFGHLTAGVAIASPLIWECTRFCLAPGAERRVTAGLVLGAGMLMERFALEHFVGVFDPRMERIYGLLGPKPEVIGRAGSGEASIGVGLWAFDESLRPRVLSRVGVARAEAEGWWDASFRAAPREKVLEPVPA